MVKGAHPELHGGAVKGPWLVKCIHIGTKHIIHAMLPQDYVSL